MPEIHKTTVERERNQKLPTSQLLTDFDRVSSELEIHYNA